MPFELYYHCSDNFAQTAAVNIGQHLVERISEVIVGWHNYIYDGRALGDINDGGDDMFDGGNRVIVLYY